MRPPAELDEVQWQALNHAYGPAEDLPALVRALYQGDEEIIDEAIYELHGNIWHQGTVYEASAPAVPFLAHAAIHVSGRRAELLMLLAVLADHEPKHVDGPRWPDSSVGAVCAELCRVLPELLVCLGAPERGVRRAVLRVVAAVGDLLSEEQRAVIAEQVAALYVDDHVPAVRADAVVCLEQLGRGPDGLADLLPEVRLAAAVLAAERSQPPYSPALVEVMAQDGAEPDPGDDDLPWSGLRTLDDRLTRLLREDPRAGLTVAARWISAGDLGTRGSWLAEKIVETWRDQEPDVLDLLQAALPQQREARAIAGRLRAIGHWIELVPEPGTGIRDTLHRFANDEDEETTASALLALVCSRDARAPRLVLCRPTARLLGAAARHFPEDGELLIPAIRRELAAGATGNDGIALVQSLAHFGAAARQAQPELVDCLRTRRAAIVAARLLGTNGSATPETIDLLREATQSADLSLRSTAAVAHYQLTGETHLALSTFEGLLSGVGPVHWYLGALEPLGAAATPLLPLIEPMLEGGDWTRMAAAEAHYWITGTPNRAVPVLSELVGASPVGLRALKALAATGVLPEDLRPTLRGFAFSPRRLLTDTPVSGQGHADEELRMLARSLLST
ncbi:MULTISPECIES: hypothetical protein [Streptacidiphilus]|uniref:HEAT repeat domain-containing protein n=1 Tax=Streptacidiphilus cavernicola TaxID=3342716 RepID=A0ABV6UYB7_9ACTN|nr:hypothetical protein [Streptacidiphilus jeojiense]